MSRFRTYIALACLLTSLSCGGAEAHAQRNSRRGAKAASADAQRKKTQQEYKPNNRVYKARLGSRARTFYINGNPFFCDGGDYYRQNPDKWYEEIETPRNVIFDDIPYGARKTYFNGYTFYDADGMWFMQIGSNFLLVDQPGTNTKINDTLPGRCFHGTFGY